MFSEIGYSQEKLMKENPAYVNTCAVRMSLTLLKSGVQFKGKMLIQAGKLKGKSIEPGAKLLADQLALPHILSKPTLHKPADFVRQINGKKAWFFSGKLLGMVVVI